MSDGQTTTIENLVNEKMPEIKPGTIVSFDEKTGEILIDGKPSGFFANTEAEGEVKETKLPYVNEAGELILVDKDGKEVSTGILVSPVTAIQKADGSWVLTVIGADGKKQQVEIPSAAAMITSFKVMGPRDLSFVQYKFAPEEATIKLWKDNGRKLPKSNSWFVSTKHTYPYRLEVQPLNVDAKDLASNIKLVDSQMNAATDVEFSVSDHMSNEYPFTWGDRNPHTRAEAQHNGIYNLIFKTKHFENKEGINAFDKQFSFEQDDYNYGKEYAFSIGNHRTDFRFIVGDINDAELHLNDESLCLTDGLREWRYDYAYLDLNTEYVVGVCEYGNELYDLWIEVSKEDKELFGLEFNENNTAFKATKNPDKLTSADFEITIHGIDLSGKYIHKTMRVEISSKISDAVEYKPVSHVIKTKAEKNHFNIDLKDMKDALGTNLTLWMSKVNLAQTDFALYNADMKPMENGYYYFSASELQTKYGINPAFVSSVKDESQESVSKDKANFIKFNVDNAIAAKYFELDKQYYVEVRFNGGGHLNSIVVPVTFTAPEVSTLFAVKDAYQIDNVINAYLDNSNAETITLNKYFNKFVKDATVKLNNEAKVEGDKTAQQLFVKEGNNFNETTLKLAGNFANNKPAAGYGKAIEVIATVADYEGWKYEKKYKFNIRLLNPIYEGTILTKDGAVSIKANDLKNGAYITAEDIWCNDYNKNRYELVPDKVNGTEPTWNEPIVKVGINKDANKYIKEVTTIAASKTSKGALVLGKFKVTGDLISKTTTVELPVVVEDAWGYKKSDKIKVTLISANYLDSRVVNGSFVKKTRISTIHI